MNTRRALVAVLITIVSLPIVVLGVAWWCVRTQSGSAWLLARVPGVQIDSPRGVLLGDFGARHVTVQLPGGKGTIVLSNVAWHSLRIARAPSPLWLRVAFGSLEASTVVVTQGPSTTTANAPATAPATLALPVEVEVEALRIGAVQAGATGDEPLRGLTARVHLGADAGREHRIEDLGFTRAALHVQASVRVGTALPMPLDAALVLTQEAGSSPQAWSLQAKLAGPLAAPVAQIALHATALPGEASQALDARATLHPFAPWPIGDVHASATAFDLAAFSSAAPKTRLSGTLEITSKASDQPAQVVADMTNALAGPWNEHRLPLRSVKLELAARPDQADVLELRAFSAELGTADTGAGSLRGRGGWSPEAWNLSMTLDALQPARLDVRAPAVRLSGPIALSGAAASLDTVNIKADLRGALARRGAGSAAQVTVDATLNPKRVEIRDLQVSAGGARATLQGLVSTTASDQPWSVSAQAAMKDFDPAVWWPGPEGSAWRHARDRLNAHGKVSLQLPAAALHQPVLKTLAAMRGDAALTLDRSWLAGVPLVGEAMLRSRQGVPLQATLAFDAEGNHLQAQGHLGITGSGADDTWDLSIDGPALHRLAPIVQLFEKAGADATVRGSVTAKAQVRGRWPVLTTQGQLDIQALRVGTLRVQQAEGRWNIGTSADSPADAHLTLTQAGIAGSDGPGPSVESMQLQLQGTGHEHQLSVRAESRGRPPAWIESLHSGAPPPATGTGTVATLQARGGLVSLPDAKPGASVSGWHGALQDLELRGAGPASLLRIRDVTLDALWGSGPLRVRLQPGRAELPVGVLHWSRFAWTAPGSATDRAGIDVDAALDALRVAPLLALAQPDLGWTGDLAVSARMKLRNTGPDSAFSADVVVERDAGDLTLTDDQVQRALGVTSLRLNLAVDQGNWTLTQSLAATSLGKINGRMVARAAPEALWPGADAPLEGGLELQVSDLATWGNWLPTGWRLYGALGANASLSGRFGAPEITGGIQGEHLSVRNFMQGVNVSEGDVALVLRGSTAHIERFTAKAGSGTLTLAGDATLGAAPRAVLDLTAERFQLLGRVDRRIVTSGKGRLELGLDSLSLAGEFGIDEGLIELSRSDVAKLPEDIDVTYGEDAKPAGAAASAASPARAPRGPKAKPVRNVALDLKLSLGEKLRLRGRGLDAGLRGDLHITSPGGQLAVTGAVRTVDGSFAAYGQKLDIDRGVVTFNGNVEDPRLDIEATRPNIEIRVGVAITGLASQARVRLFSEPELPEIDKLSWLLQGHANSGMDNPDLALLQAAAIAMVAGEGAGPGDQFTQTLGLDRISVRKSEGDTKDTVVGLGKQLSRNWYVGYERGLNATTGSFQLIYRVAQRFTLRANSGVDSKLDVIWVWRWQ